jgi:hypothetical protein
MSEYVHSDQVDHITVQSLTSSSPEEINRWVSLFQEAIRQTPEDQPVLIVLDFSSHRVGFTPHLRQQGQMLLSWMAGRHGYIAVVLGTPWGRQFVRLLLRTHNASRIVFHLCASQQEGLAWVKRQRVENALKKR